MDGYLRETRTLWILLPYVHQGASTEEKALNKQTVIPGRATHVSSSVLSQWSAYTIGP